MSKVEAERKSIPLFEVVEHIVGDLGQVVLQYADLDPKESGLPQAAGADFSDERVRAKFGNWEVLLPVDEATGVAWEGAWKKLSAAVRNGKLLVRGFRGGSEYSEEIKPEEFPELWHNRYSDFDLNVEYSGDCFLEFDGGDKATILNGHSLGASKVIWTDLCAVSGADVLSLWPLQPRVTASPDESLREATGSAATIRVSHLEISSIGGKKSGDVRRANRAWVSHATELAVCACSNDPQASNEKIAGLIADRWRLEQPSAPGVRTLTKLIAELRGDGKLPQRTASFLKRSG